MEEQKLTSTQVCAEISKSCDNFRRGVQEAIEHIAFLTEDSGSNSDLWYKALAGYEMYNGKAAKAKDTIKKDEYCGQAFAYGILMEIISPEK